jgi:hypothetical protein
MVHLVQAPFGSLALPSLALGQIAAQLHEAGRPARVHYHNLLFARLLGFGVYESLARLTSVEPQVAEWLFAREAWGQGLEEGHFGELYAEALGRVPGIPDPRAWITRSRDD